MIKSCPRGMKARSICILMTGALLSLGACKSGDKSSGTPPRHQPSGSKSQLIYKGGGQLLSKHDENEARLLAEWSNQISGHIRQGRLLTATMRIRESPEYALRWLWLVSSQPSRRLNEKLVLRTVARVYDRHILALPQDGLSGFNHSGWLAAIKWIDENPSAFHGYLERKKTFQSVLEKKGNPASAFEGLTRSLPGNLPNQLRQAAHAGWMLSAAAGEMQAAYWQASVDLEGADPLLLMHSHLAMGQALGAQENLYRATDAGVSLARRGIFPLRQWQQWQGLRQKMDGQIISQDQYLMDKKVLESLSALLGPDAQLSWQLNLRSWIDLQLQQARNGAGLDAVNTLLLIHAGLNLLNRGNAHDALIAFKKAELSSRNLAIETELKLHQARALAEMDQIGGATGLLMPLITTDTPTGRSAISALALVKLQRDQLPQAIALWQKAIASTSLEAWPGRSQAQADLGLAYLMMGQEQKGLDLLHLAQATMKKIDPEVFLISLENERQYYEQMGLHQQALAMQQQIASLEAN